LCLSFGQTVYENVNNTIYSYSVELFVDILLVIKMWTLKKRQIVGLMFVYTLTDVVLVHVSKNLLLYSIRIY